MVRALSLFVGIATARRVAVEQDTKLNVTADTEVCCLCFQETGDKTNWKVKSYVDDSDASLNGAGFDECRLNRGDGESDCSVFCAYEGMEMKGCMKGSGMAEWRAVEHWDAKTNQGENSWACESDSESTCGCGGASLLETDEWIEDVEEDLVVATTAPETEVCCLCFAETGEKTDWMVKAYADDADGAVNGAGFGQCRLNRGDGESDCSAHCAEKGMEMKGCMKGSGMAEWRTAEHWAAQTVSGENSWTCASDTSSDSCSCGSSTSSLLESESEAGMCVLNCITKANGKLNTRVQVYSRTKKSWCSGKITQRNEVRGITVHYTCKGVNLKKLIPWKEANKFVRTDSIMGR